MQSLLYYTVSSKEIRIYMPSIPVLLVATSFIRYHQDGTLYLSSLKLPAHIMQRGADWGGYRVATHWCGHPPFTLTQYLYWLVDLQPQWAAMMDLPCLTENGMYPGADEVKRRQDFTTDMAYLIWERCRHLNWSWCITVQGYHLSEYEAHAKELASLIKEMQAYYTSPEWRKKGPAFTFRVGIGSLNHGLKTTHVLEIIRVIAEILGQDILFHLWGTKLKFLQHPVESPQILSMDTGAWSGLFGKVHEERRQSGLSVAQFSWQTAQPRYAQKVKTAEARPKQSTLTLKPDRTFTAAPGYHLYEVHHLVDDIPLFGTGAAETYWTQDRKRHFWQVSIVEAKDLEHLFELTNSFDGPWTAGSHVLWKSSEHLRSTSVGDVVMDMQSHQTCIVAPHGFRELMPPTAEA